MAYDTVNKQFTDIPATHVRCWCGVSFAVPESLYDEYTRKNDRRSGSMHLWCPLGHSMIPAGPSEAQQLRDKLARAITEHSARERHLMEQRDTAARRAAAARGQVTKVKRRISRGVCPCCNRTFADLARHMSGQHPDWSKDEA